MVQGPARHHLARAVSVVVATALGAQIAFAQPKPATPAPPAGSAAPSASAAPAASSAAPVTSATASAAPAASSAAPATSAPGNEGPTPAMKEEARGHFTKGLGLMQEGAFSAALAEFTASLDLFPTRNATLNAAYCLRKLQRFDDSLDMYERFLRDFQNIPAEDKSLAQRAITEMRGLVGTVDIQGAEPGALISISGIARGEYPPVAPIRVAAGSQLVRVFKEGYEPYETRVDVAGGSVVTVQAKMQALKASGRLKVVESGGRAVDVIVDNSVVGQAPWEGLVAVGKHMVMLRGQGKLGTQPVSAEVKSGQISSLSVRAEELDGALRVTPTPPNALVSLNSVDLGSGNWTGRVKSGVQKVEISAPGFLKLTRDVKVEAGGIAVVDTALERDDDAPQWQKPSKFFADATVGFAIAPSFAGDIADNCKEGCAGGLGLGPFAQLHAGYERGSGFGIGLTLAYLAAFQDTTNRDAKITPAVNLAPIDAKATDHLLLTGYAAGAHLSIRYGEKIPFLARASGGVMFARIRDERSGSFSGAPIASAAMAVDSIYAFANPELRLGYKFTDRFEAALDLQAFMLIATKQPKWDATIQRDVGGQIGTYQPDALTGQVVLFVIPGLAARYDF